MGGGGGWRGRWPPKWRNVFPCLRQMERMLFPSPALNGICGLFPNHDQSFPLISKGFLVVSLVFTVTLGMTTQRL